MLYVQEYANKAKILLTSGKKPSKDRTLTVVGGQSGAGKTRLISMAKNEFDENAVILDLVELMKIHPSYRIVTDKYPQMAYWIIQEDIDSLKEQMENYLIENGYNVINESAFRRAPKMIKLCEKFANNGYKINLKIMAVPRLNSLGAIFTRYASKLVVGQSPRWVKTQTHDESYEGVIPLTQELIRSILAQKQPDLLDTLDDWEKLYEKEKEYVYREILEH